MSVTFKERLRRVPNAFFRQSYGFRQSLAIALVVAAAAFYGLFTPIDGFIYDAFVRTTPAPNHLKRQVVLIDVPIEKFSSNDTDWETIISRVMDLGAKQVIFTLTPTFDRKTLERLLTHKHVIVGGVITPDLDRPGNYKFISAPMIGSLTFPAVTAIPDPLLGVHRYQHFGFLVNHQQLPTVETLTAQRLDIPAPDAGRFMINFSGQQHYFPRMSLAQALEGALIKDIVQGRVIMIGPALDRLHRSVVTPITQGSRQVSELEYHAFALDSLLNRADIISLWPAAKGLIVMAAWFVGFLILQPMAFRQGMLAFSAIGIAMLIVAWLALAIAQIHIPVLAALLVLGTTLVSVFQSKGQRQNQQLSRLVNETTLLVSGRGSSQLAVSAASFWGHVIAMLDQLMPLSRAALLANANGSRYVRLVHTLRCPSDVIHERRRDLQRTPYSTALAANSPIEVNRYLESDGTHESQLLVPLQIEGEVLGFLALAFPTDAMKERSALMRTLTVLGMHLSDLLLERRQVEEREQTIKAWQKTLRDPRDDAIQALSHNTRIIGQYTTVLQDMINGLEAATAVYDLFGRTVLVNKRMAIELPKMGIASTELTAVDLLAAACEMSLNDARDIIVRVVFDDLSFERTAHLGESSFLLLASALRDTSAPTNTRLASLESLHGVMFQLFPVSNIVQREIVRRNAAATFVNDQHPVSANVSRPLVIPSSRERGASQSNTSSFVDVSVEEIDLWRTIELLAELIREEPQHEHVALHIEGDKERAKVFVPFIELKTLLRALLQLLVEDSRLKGLVSITIQTAQESTRINMRNNGFGIPDEKLQAMLSGPAIPQSASLRTIRQARQALLAHKGSLSLHSEVGKGYVVTLGLPKHS